MEHCFNDLFLCTGCLSELLFVLSLVKGGSEKIRWRGRRGKRLIEMDELCVLVLLLVDVVLLLVLVVLVKFNFSYMCLVLLMISLFIAKLVL